MSEKPISDLRRRMIAGHDGPQLRRQDPARLYPARRDLCQISRPLARYGERRGHPPLPGAQIEQGAQPPKMNTQASALRFFFTITLGRADLAHQLARAHYPRKLPRVLSPGGGGAAARGRARPRPQVQGRAEHRLRRRSARRRGRHAAGRRHRLPSAC